MKPLIGISTCLLGESVRYDGGHKLDRYLRDTLGQFVEFVPVCPEVDCGMNTPREALRLVELDDDIRLITQKTKQDLTPKMTHWMQQQLTELDKLPLCGFIFKAKSPSSGLMRVKIYNEKGNVIRQGRGIFAQGFTDHFPSLPVEEEGRLHDSNLRENFIERIFIMQRWHQLCTEPKSVKHLVNFHTQHKYLIMAHSPKAQSELGQLVAKGKSLIPDNLYQQYLSIMLAALNKIATVKKNTNVLHHIMGYFKNQLTADEKAELKDVIGSYHLQQVPLIVPLTLLNHYVRKYDEPYLTKQLYLKPHPKELMLRNHV